MRAWENVGGIITLFVAADTHAILLSLFLPWELVLPSVAAENSLCLSWRPWTLPIKAGKMLDRLKSAVQQDVPLRGVREPVVVLGANRPSSGS